MKIGSCLPIVFSQVIYSGGYSDGEPPLPIPNREAKPVIADGTARSGGRVGSRRAWKESSDEKSSGDSFFVFAGVRGNAVQDILVFCGWRMWPASLLPLRSKFRTCPRHTAMRVSLCPVPMSELCLSVSLFCRIFSLCQFRGCLRSYVLMRSQRFRSFAFQ